MQTQKAMIKLGKHLSHHAQITSSIKNRNLSALSPLLKKGGVHDKDNPKPATNKRASKHALHSNSGGLMNDSPH